MACLARLAHCSSFLPQIGVFDDSTNNITLVDRQKKFLNQRSRKIYINFSLLYHHQLNNLNSLRTAGRFFDQKK